ncbi:hypothetical protein G3576_30680 [Roseomonas stagni]|uniref:Uncharacterized protein n=1 Tax=Falsiroseomonas algicola TaxID=2716930 RepID=A0A6M1LWJ0_9PROT|nr:hypothetical protein [Falsiroseomonas algicola]NGM24389.1 hypothetical protein [Falsiroseomonas algicola]
MLLPLPRDAAGVFELSLEGRVYGTLWTGVASVLALLDESDQHEWRFTDDNFHWQSAEFYRHSKGSGKIDLTISRIGGISPKSVGAGDDERVLGVLVRRIIIKQKQK